MALYLEWESGDSRGRELWLDNRPALQAWLDYLVKSDKHTHRWTIAGEALPMLDLKELEKTAIEQALWLADGKQREAAKLLGVSERVMSDKVNKGNEG